MLIIISIVLASPLIAVVTLTLKSQVGSPPGINDSRLRPCPHKPNCITSEYPNDNTHYSQPIKMVDTNIDVSMADFEKIIIDMGGSINSRTSDYIAATFSSAFLKFVDDFELRLDSPNRLVHFRAASRVGYSDWGVNKTRIETLKNRIRSTIQQNNTH